MITLDAILNEVESLCRSRRAVRGKTIRWIIAPQTSLPGTPAVQGVALTPNEDVQWTWTHTANGSYVSGYTIVPRLTPRTVILSEAKNLSRSGRVAPVRRKRGPNR